MPKRIITSAEDFSALLSFIKDNIKEYSFDFETTSLDVREAEIVGAAIGYEWEGVYWGFYIPVGHKRVVGFTFDVDKAKTNKGDALRQKKALRENQVPFDVFYDGLKGLFCNGKTHTVYFHNVKYDAQIWFEAMSRNGEHPRFDPDVLDTQMSALLLHRPKLGLKILALEELGYKMVEFEEVSGGYPFDLVDPLSGGDYAADDGIQTLRLGHKHAKELKASKEPLYKIWKELQSPFFMVLALMEWQGALIDSRVLYDLDAEFAEKESSAKQELFELIGKEINLNSPPQIANLFYEELGWWSKLAFRDRKTDAGNWPTNSEALEDIASSLPEEHFATDEGKLAAQLILKFRKYNKYRSTYTTAIPTMLDKNGRIHSSFWFTDTYRLTSSAPNLQNIPARDKEGKKIRGAFIAPPGWVILDADYSQLELRILAHMSGDKNLIEAFLSGEDLHAKTAAGIFDIPIELVDELQRRKGKTINFGVVYGQGAVKYSKSVGVPVEQGKKDLNKYFRLYPGVPAYKSYVKRFVEANNYARSLIGRTRLFTKETRENYKGLWLNAAGNHPIQCGASDIISLAMVKLVDELKKREVLFEKVRLTLQVHDELVFEVREDYVEEFRPILKDIMENTIKLKVPLIADPGQGSSWLEAK